MCKSCRTDDRYVKNMYLRQGAVEAEDFEEVPYRHPKRRKKKVKEKTRPGCPGNDYQAHVYVWTIEDRLPDFFSDYYGFPRYQHNVCAGCGKSKGSKESDQYMKIKERLWNKLPDVSKGEPVSRWARGYTRFKWWRWENEDADYLAARKEYIDRNGWPSYLYNSY